MSNSFEKDILEEEGSKVHLIHRIILRVILSAFATSFLFYIFSNGGTSYAGINIILMLTIFIAYNLRFREKKIKSLSDYIKLFIITFWTLLFVFWSSSNYYAPLDDQFYFVIALIFVALSIILGVYHFVSTLSSRWQVNIASLSLLITALPLSFWALYLDIYQNYIPKGYYIIAYLLFIVWIGIFFLRYDNPNNRFE